MKSDAYLGGGYWVGENAGQVHKVEAGEYLSLIAENYGIPQDRIWLHSENTNLRNKRKSPNILNPGDELFIPGKEARSEDASTDTRHQFVLKSGKQKLRMVLRDHFGKPLCQVEYQLWLSGRPTITGTIGDDGLLEAEIPTAARTATLMVLGKQWDLDVGALNPISLLSGVQQRLNNLGFPCGEADGIMGPKTRSALTRFQRRAGLDPTGHADDATRRKIEEMHEGATRNLAIEDSAGAPVKSVRQVREQKVDDEPVERMEPGDLESLEGF